VHVGYLHENENKWIKKKGGGGGDSIFPTLASCFSGNNVNASYKAVCSNFQGTSVGL